MRKVALVLSGMILGFAIFAESGVVVRKTMSGDLLKEVVVENDTLRVRIIRKGGRVISFYDKSQKMELSVSGNGAFDGICKTRDWKWHNSEPHSANYALKIVEETPAKVVVEASRDIKSGALAGCRLTKRYTLSRGVDRLDAVDMVRCLEKRVSFQLNSHNLFSLKTFTSHGMTFYIPSKRGMVRFTSSEAAGNGNNIVYDVSAPWIAAVAPDTGRGVALVAGNIKTLNAMFAWAGSRAFTIEPVFTETSLRSEIGTNTRKFSYSIIPLKGLSSVDGVSANLAYNVTSKNGKSVLTAYFPLSLGASSLKISQSGKCLAKTEMVLKAGSVVQIEFSPVTSGGKCALAVNGKTRGIRAEFTAPSDKKRIFFPPDTKIKKNEVSGIKGYYYYYDDLWISSDVWTNISFGLKGDFRKKKNLRLVVEVPPGIEMKNLRREKFEKKSIKKNGKDWIRYSIYAGRTKTYFSAVPLLLKAEKKFAKPTNATIATVWDGGELPAKNLTIRFASFPGDAPKLKTLQIGFSGGSYLYRNWPNICGDLKKTGINFIEIWDWPDSTLMAAHKGDGSYSDLIEMMHSKGIDTSFEFGCVYGPGHKVLAKSKYQYQGAQILFHPKKRKNPIDVEDAKAVTISGKKKLVVCPSYRGPLYDKAMDMVKSAVDYGARNLHYDEEQYGQGASICFCERCKKKFKEYLKANHPKLKYVDPMLFEKKPSEYPKLDEAWWQFKTDNVADMYKGIRETLDTYNGGKAKNAKIYVYVSASAGEGRYGAIVQRLTDYAKIGKYVDVLLPMIYTADPAMIGNIAVKGKKAAGAGVQLGTALAPNRSYELYRVEGNDFPPIDAARYQILETFFAGGRMVHFWAPYATLKGAGSFREIRKAVETIAPVEEILADGKQDQTLKSSNSDIRIRAFRLKNQVAILAAEYGNDALKTTITCPVSVKSIVIDARSGKTIAEITPVASSFPLTLETDRARVLWVKPSSK